MTLTLSPLPASALLALHTLAQAAFGPSAVNRAMWPHGASAEDLAFLAAEDAKKHGKERGVTTLGVWDDALPADAAGLPLNTSKTGPAEGLTAPEAPATSADSAPASTTAEDSSSAPAPTTTTAPTANGAIAVSDSTEPKGALIAVGRWRLEDEETFDEPESASGPSLAPGMNREAMAAFLGPMTAGRKELMGRRRYWHLQLLCTYATHERRGAGRALLQWGLQRADAEGLDAYLNASEFGRPLYERFGFEVKIQKYLDLRPFGVEADQYDPGMVRPARRKEEVNGVGGS